MTKGPILLKDFEDQVHRDIYHKMCDDVVDALNRNTERMVEAGFNWHVRASTVMSLLYITMVKAIDTLDITEEELLMSLRIVKSAYRKTTNES